MIKGLTLQSILPSIVMIICNIAALGETPGTNLEALHKPIRNLVITDPMLAYAQAEEEIRVGTANREPNRVGLGHLIMGNVHWVLGNLPSAQEKYYSALQIFEEEESQYGLITTHNDLSLVYLDEQNFEDCANHLRKALQLNKSFNDQWLQTIIESNLGDVFLKRGSLDSARHYTTMSYHSALEVRDESLFPFILMNLGKISMLDKDWSAAQLYLQKGIETARFREDNTHLSLLLISIGDLMMEMTKIDSAFRYYSEAWNHALQLESLSEMLNTAKKLQNYYHKQNRMDSAFSFSLHVQSLQDSLLGSETVRLMTQRQHLEQIRKKELLQEKEQEHEARKRLKQYLLIVLLILLLIGSSSLLKKVRISSFWLEFYLVTTLLLIFEFLTLMAHSVFGYFTHHDPLPTLIFLLILSSLLSPLHHHSKKYGKKLLNIN